MHRCSACLRADVATEEIDVLFFDSVPYRARVCQQCDQGGHFLNRLFERIFGSP